MIATIRRRRSRNHGSRRRVARKGLFVRFLIIAVRMEAQLRPFCNVSALSKLGPGRFDDADARSSGHSWNSPRTLG